ncbi:hypothetical protein NEPAR06_0838 [Nematocida parisii]|uniref:Uncharacterized protein n=1 Tax=Nematocida parisii (strain ERTm3) TaxID=935791 RepID=I3EEI0_NEMP3|nr:uncharacterized protein NEPG_02254 [Nematocida parisii ERTm1]EIJ87627.1 hypothetical protein NEQG_02174 [Nematocida parisii ERTm3]KAI5143950.1 hypothetical protein NEPAR07_0947 [Nematocida parisii]EIJ92855.1 hypothetical protein NEPG_02254 [Nematocida parisii ERTm1]KAI5154056.1 hypothetical protein NEPAR06_0838 [Nematocida parisii]KAI5156835.1 hypothetical protein NEPAR05_0831 [Nematocida parisii]|eukprot:XP_013060081.1 hypothetical protein NEPG_02254 [Nematocida parisii ERTm1]
MDFNNEMLRSNSENIFFANDKDSETSFYEKRHIIYTVLNMYARRVLFKEEFLELNNLAYNAFMVFLCEYIEKTIEYNQDMVIPTIDKAIEKTRMFVGGIYATGQDIKNHVQRDAYYNFMNTNHLFILDKNLLDWYMRTDIMVALSNNVYAQTLGPIDAFDALNYLFKPSSSGKCSRLQRVLDIITEFGGMLAGQDGEEGAELSLYRLGLDNDDVYSLYIFVCTNHIGVNVAVQLIKEVISAKRQQKNGFPIIQNIYSALFFMIEKTHNLSDTAIYTKNVFKYVLKDLQSYKNPGSIKFIDNLKPLRERYPIDTDSFIENVSDVYRACMQEKIGAIFSSPIPISIDNGLNQDELKLVDAINRLTISPDDSPAYQGTLKEFLLGLLIIFILLAITIFIVWCIISQIILSDQVSSFIKRILHKIYMNISYLFLKVLEKTKSLQVLDYNMVN